MLWREVDITTFPVETLRGWMADLGDEIETIQLEIDRRATNRVDEVMAGREVSGRIARPTDRGAPPRRSGDGG